MNETNSAALRMPQASSPLKSELLSDASSPSSLSQPLAESESGASQASALAHEREYVNTNRQEHQRELGELEDFRKLALEKQPFESPTQGGSFEPFVGSRVGSPIPDRNGLGWPGESRAPVDLVSLVPGRLVSSVAPFTDARSDHAFR